MTRDQLTGVPERVLIGTDLDLEADRRGPAALDRAMQGLTRGEVAARYRDLLARHNHLRGQRRSGRRAWEDFDTNAVAEERRATTRGGNR